MKHRILITKLLFNARGVGGYITMCIFDKSHKWDAGWDTNGWDTNGWDMQLSNVPPWLFGTEEYLIRDQKLSGVQIIILSF